MYTPLLQLVYCTSRLLLQQLSIRFSVLVVLQLQPAKCRETLCLSLVLPQQGIVKQFLRRHYPPLIATTVSCAEPSSSQLLQFPYSTESLLIAASPSWYMVLPIVNPTIFHLVSSSLPRKPLKCIYPFLPSMHRPSPRDHRIGCFPNPHYNFCVGTYFEATNISLRLNPRLCLPF